MSKPLLVFVGVYLFTYLTGAFIGWEMNPAVWSAEGRLLLVSVGTIGGLIGASLMAEIQCRF